MACITASAWGQPGGFGPSRVEAQPAIKGTLAPTTEFRGTVYFKAISEVASEVAGKIEDVHFETGETVEAGAALVTLDHSLLDRELASIEATRQRYSTELRDARVRFDRSEALLADGIATTEQVDELRFRVESLRHQVASVAADIDRLKTLIGKYTIYSPFSGVVVERKSERGEWLSAGTAVGTVARTGIYEVLANVPEQYLAFVNAGGPTNLVIGGEEYSGTIETVLPRGDIATRSFSVKVIVETERDLLEGMSAMVNLPTGAEISCVLIPRDGIVQLPNRKSVFTVAGNKAVEHSITVLGYQGEYAGVQSNGLQPGVEVIVKGQERLRDGAEVEVVNTPQARLRTE